MTTPTVAPPTVAPPAVTSRKPAPPAPPSAATGDPARTPIKILELRISHANPNGVELPIPGAHGGHTHRAHSLVAGTRSGMVTEIDYRPWLRMYRISVSTPGTSPKVFYMPYSWACYVPLGD